MIETTQSVENDSNAVLYVMDETGLRTESDNRRSWSLKGLSPTLESNGSHAGLNIIGATEITKNYDTISDVYSADHSITNVEIEAFIEHLLELNPNKKVYLVLDNAPTHNNKKIQAYWSKHTEQLVLINTARYSPQLNPQENIWKLLKDKIFSTKARAAIDDLYNDVLNIYKHLNEYKDIIKSIVNPRNYYFKTNLKYT